MAYEFKLVRRVEFSDTDMAGIMHYSNYFLFMEATEAAFLRSLGFSIVKTGEPPVAWPRVHAECDYKMPLRFEDEVEVHLLVKEIKSKAINYVFRFRKLNAAPPVVVARGAQTVVCVTHHPDGRMAVCPVPKFVTDHIQPAPPQLTA
jgi:YbgC/YbaW family acyl-CoA thioester hydrolase